MLQFVQNSFVHATVLFVHATDVCDHATVVYFGLVHKTGPKSMALVLYQGYGLGLRPMPRSQTYHTILGHTQGQRPWSWAKGPMAQGPTDLVLTQLALV